MILELLKVSELKFAMKTELHELKVLRHVVQKNMLQMFAEYFSMILSCIHIYMC